MFIFLNNFAFHYKEKSNLIKMFFLKKKKFLKKGFEFVL